MGGAYSHRESNNITGNIHYICFGSFSCEQCVYYVHVVNTFSYNSAFSNKERTMKIKLLTSTAKAPVRSTSEAAGYDLYADNDEPIHIVMGAPKSVSTGVAMAIPKGYVGLVQPRSGLAFSKGIGHLAGVIDADFTGEVKLLLTSHSTYGELRIERGDRVAQIVVVPCYMGDIELVDTLEDTERGSRGFGHTGIK